MHAEHIIDDDPRFLRWIQDHAFDGAPTPGLVLNAHTKPSATYLKLHTARCDLWKKKHKTRQPFTGRVPRPNGSGLSKIVGLSLRDLRDKLAELGLPKDVRVDDGCPCLRGIDLGVRLRPLADNEGWSTGSNIGSGAFVVQTTDTRAIAVCAIRLRRGQSSFREALIERYGPRCMVTGCDVLSVIEAAHIKPYRGDSDNHASNGLLLRSDIHTLFDLNRLGIDPKSTEIALSSTLHGTLYASYEGVALSVRGNQHPSVDALRLRWSEFVRSK